MVAVERSDVFGPQGAHHTDVLVGSLSACAEVAADGFGFLADPPDTDAQLEASAAEPIEGGELFGQDQRVALRQDQYAGREPDTLGDRRDSRQPDQRVGLDGVRIERRAAARVVGVDRVVLHGHDNVFDDPDRLEAGAFDSASETGGEPGVFDRREAVRRDDSEFHFCCQPPGGASIVHEARA